MIQTITLRTHTGADGQLHLNIPTTLVAVEQGDLLEDLQTIVVLDEWLQLDDREQALFLHG